MPASCPRGLIVRSRDTGGIIHYAKFVREGDDASLFKGVNHVFDQRHGATVGAQRVAPQVLGQCHACQAAADSQTDCAYKHCPLPFNKRRFILCGACCCRLDACCSRECQEALLSARYARPPARPPARPDAVRAQARRALTEFYRSLSHAVRDLERLQAAGRSQDPSGTLLLEQARERVRSAEKHCQAWKRRMLEKRQALRELGSAATV